MTCTVCLMCRALHPAVVAYSPWMQCSRSFLWGFECTHDSRYTGDAGEARDVLDTPSGLPCFDGIHRERFVELMQQRSVQESTHMLRALTQLAVSRTPLDVGELPSVIPPHEAELVRVLAAEVFHVTCVCPGTRESLSRAGRDLFGELAEQYVTPFIWYGNVRTPITRARCNPIHLLWQHAHARRSCTACSLLCKCM
jgi:hypothetical protein